MHKVNKAMLQFDDGMQCLFITAQTGSGYMGGYMGGGSAHGIPARVGVAFRVCNCGVDTTQTVIAS